jgi:hypothetical protein
MKIRLRPKHPQLEADNDTTAHNKEFAEPLRGISKKRDIEKIDGWFSVYLEKKRMVLQLDFINK